ncbi:hypothetical protein L4C33_20825 [Vibrio makurazakiensis]|uniref:hypothetical protein n=1 Tax=Vibrio makurazakiensis TaxID=2910250 RepID=UPI003D12D3DD
MLLDLVIHNINHFQDDCLKMCERNYPAVHNHGISEHHIGKAFARRMENTFKAFSHPCVIHPLETVESTDLPNNFRVTSDSGTIWVMTHHMVSAGKTCRKKLLSSIHEWQSEYGYSIQPNDLLILICDHWIGRSKNSRELLHWWMGELPDEINEYSEQGITLYKSESQLANSLSEGFNISPCYIKFAHPLKRSTNKQLIRKYIQLYAVLQW